MFITIFLQEWRIIQRNYTLLILLLFCLLPGTLSISMGLHRYRYQQQAIDSVLQRSTRSQAALHATFDTIRFTANQRHAIEDPYVLDYESGLFLIRTPHPLAVFCIGQNDVFPFIRRAWMGSELFSNDYEEFRNPVLLQTGQLDFSYFLFFLFPLLFIALTYNAASADRENGTAALLAVQATNAQRILPYRLFCRWLFVLVPMLLLFGGGCLYIRQLPGFTAADALQWLGALLLYAFFWLILVYAVLQRGWNSMINALALAGSWVLLLVALPGLCNAWLRIQHPDSFKTETTLVREVTYSAWEKPFAEQKAHLLRQLPQLPDTIKTDSNDVRMFAYVSWSDSVQQAIHHKLMTQIRRRATAEHHTYWLNPLAGILHFIANTSHSSVEQHLQFEKASANWQQQRIRQLYTAYFTQPHITKEIYNALPLPGNNTAPATGKMRFLLPALVWMLLLGLAARRSNNKHNQN